MASCLLLTLSVSQDCTLHRQRWWLSAPHHKRSDSAPIAPQIVWLICWRCCPGLYFSPLEKPESICHVHVQVRFLSHASSSIPLQPSSLLSNFCPPQQCRTNAMPDHLSTDSRKNLLLGIDGFMYT